jgi:hypothetical protein
MLRATRLPSTEPRSKAILGPMLAAQEVDEQATEVAADGCSRINDAGPCLQIEKMCRIETRLRFAMERFAAPDRQQQSRFDVLGRDRLVKLVPLKFCDHSELLGDE